MEIPLESSSNDQSLQEEVRNQGTDRVIMLVTAEELTRFTFCRLRSFRKNSIQDNGYDSSRDTMMKILLFISVMLFSANASFGQTTGQTIGDKTKRMLQIEKKFEIVMTNIIVEKDEKFWLFQADFPEGLFGFVPVMVKAEATDKEVYAAVMSSKTCASLYDDTIKKAAKKAQEHQSGQSPMIYQ